MLEGLGTILSYISTMVLMIFVGFFVVYSMYLAIGIYARDNLVIFNHKLQFGMVTLFLLFGVSLAVIYEDLVTNGYAFKTEYKVALDANKTSVKVGTNAKSNDIHLFNAFSDEGHVVFHLGKDPKDNKIRVFSQKRSAIVNATLITDKEKEKKVRTRTMIKDEDIITLDGKKYEIILDDNTISMYDSENKKTYTAAKAIEKELLVGKDKHVAIPLNSNTLISFYFKKTPKERAFITLLKGDDVYVNKKKLSLVPKVDPNHTIFKKGDIVRLGYSDYEVDYNSKEFILHSTFFTPSVVNLFNIYATTTIPNVAQNESEGTISLWWMYGLTLAVVFMAMLGMLYLILILTRSFSFIGENRFILYPILYFSFFLSFLVFASMINFTVLQYHQFSVYNKGALYTVLLVYAMMMFTFLMARIGYSKTLLSFIAALFIVSGIIWSIWSYEGFIYTSRPIWGQNRTLLLTSADVIYTLSVFGFAFGFLIRTMKDAKKGIFLNQRVNIDVFVKGVRFSLLAIIFAAGLSTIMHEGAGIVIVETIKLFIFFLLVVVLLDDFKNQDYRNGFFGWIVFFLIGLTIIVMGLLKDTGSMLQIIVAMSIIIIFFLNHLQKIKFFTTTLKIVLFLGAIAVVVGGYLYVHHTSNVRIPMWIEPFAQGLDVNNKFFMYYFDQIAKGLYLIKQSSFLPSDFMTNVFTTLPNMHTDYIFALTVNVFGWFGFIAILVAFLVMVFSFTPSVHTFQHSHTDIYRFIYGVNVIFVAYFFSYIMVNVLAVLQVIPLTDVPFPILTYARGMTILFFVVYVFVAALNYVYLDYVNRGHRRTV